MTTFQKIWRLLTPDYHKAAIALLSLMLVGMVLETMSVGLVIPVLMMMQGDIASKYPALTPWVTRFGTPSREHLVIGVMLILVGVYAIKALFLAFLTWRQTRLVFGIQADLSQRLLAGYLRQPYSFHLQRNSAQLIYNATTQVGRVSGVILQFVIATTEIMVLLGITVLLLTIEPLGATLVVSILTLAGWGFYRFTRKRILLWSKAHLLHGGLRIQHIQQGLGGVKEVKLLGREENFLALYEVHNSNNARIEGLEQTLQMLPRLWLELLAVIGLAALIITMIWQNKPLDSLFPTLGLFAAAAFRLMPLISRVISTVQSMRFNSAAANVLYEDFQLFGMAQSPQKGQQLSFKNELVLNKVSFKYPSIETFAMRDVSLVIPKGASVGIIGGSGAGKSTFVDIILGLLTPVSGTVLVDGTDIQNVLRGWQVQIGYVPQTIYLTDDTLRRNIAFGLSEDQIDDVAVWSAIRSAQLEQFMKDLPLGIDTLVGERGIRLSGGQRQRIGIARALYNNPLVLVLDEATSSVDTKTESGIMEEVRALQGEKTIIIVAHRLSTVEHCDYIFRFENGQMVEEGNASLVLGNVC